jgi:hypothetical protein
MANNTFNEINWETAGMIIDTERNPQPPKAKINNDNYKNVGYILQSQAYMRRQRNRKITLTLLGVLVLTVITTINYYM